MLKIKLCIFLKQTQARIVKNQHVLTMCMGLERNKEKQKAKIIKQSEENIIKKQEIFLS